MEERRTLKRRHIMFYSRIFDRKTGKFLGFLGNVTTRGIMVISDEPIKQNINFKLRMDLPEYIYKKPVLNFQGFSVWCKNDIDPNFNNTGFRLTQISEEDQDIVTRFIRDYGLKD
jgi:hypothetical protein